MAAMEYMSSPPAVLPEGVVGVPPSPPDSTFRCLSTHCSGHCWRKQLEHGLFPSQRVCRS
eukprot:2257029-Rhodomonas_salina.1